MMPHIRACPSHFVGSRRVVTLYLALVSLHVFFCSIHAYTCEYTGWWAARSTRTTVGERRLSPPRRLPVTTRSLFHGCRAASQRDILRGSQECCQG
ncbi:hypothetical protein PENSPDRAFT_419100 [Peniophora sp. CONT]|nr:hypothetical protein PENSPDRAFT_419100 [Peniophora sp. CONT]